MLYLFSYLQIFLKFENHKQRESITDANYKFPKQLTKIVKIPQEL